jgi:hypothetical protein
MNEAVGFWAGLPGRLNFGWKAWGKSGGVMEETKIAAPLAGAAVKS